jgi:hypothetical protein
MTLLCDLARKHYTDKGGEHFFAGQVCHYYTPVYDSYLHPRREIVRRVLELGVNKGSSLRMWEEYFPNALIVGVDNERSCLFQTDRIHCVHADERLPLKLWKAVEPHSPYDLIVDDGSHETHDQLSSVHVLLPLLKVVHGLYFIEDISIPGEEMAAKIMEQDPSCTAIALPCKTALGPSPYRSELVLVRRRPR